MRDGGNALINVLFQAKLNDEIKANARPDCHTDLEQRSKFIYDKYQHRKWYSVTAYNKLQIRKKAGIAISKLNQDSVSEMEEDFFASRGNIGNNNSSGSGNVNDENEWWKTGSSNNDSATDGLKKSQKNHTKASDSRKATFLRSDNRRNLMSTHQMESKSKLLDDIAHLGTSSRNDEKKTKPSDIKRNSSLKKRSENGKHTSRRESIKKAQGNTNGVPSVGSRSRKAPSRSRSGDSFGGDDSSNGIIKEQGNTNDDPSARPRSRKAPSRSKSCESSGGNHSFNGSIKEQGDTNDIPLVRPRSRNTPSRSRSGVSSGGNESSAIKDGMSQITKEEERKKVSSSDKPHRQKPLGNSRPKIRYKSNGSNDDNDVDDSRITTQSEHIRGHKNGRKERISSGKPHRRKPPPGRSKSNSVAGDALVTNRMRKSEPNNDSGTSRSRPSRGVEKSKSFDMSMDSNRNHCAQTTVDSLSASGVVSESIAKEQERNSLSKNSSRSSSVGNGDRKPRRRKSTDENTQLNSIQSSSNRKSRQDRDKKATAKLTTQ